MNLISDIIDRHKTELEVLKAKQILLEAEIRWLKTLVGVKPPKKIKRIMLT